MAKEKGKKSFFFVFFLPYLDLKIFRFNTKKNVLILNNIILEVIINATVKSKLLLKV